MQMGKGGSRLGPRLDDPTVALKDGFWPRRICQLYLTAGLRTGQTAQSMNVRTLEALLKARDWTRAELARRIGLSRQAVSRWFRGEEANLHSRHLIRLSEVLGVSVAELTRPLPCFEPENHAQMRATLLWDGLFPDLDDLALALNAGDPRALGRFVEVYGLFAAEAALGPSVWRDFPSYKRYIHPARRRDLETLWAWHESREAA